MAPQPPPSPLDLLPSATGSSGALSPPSPQSPQSPNERGFFGAIAGGISRARSHSRSKMERDRSRSPLPRTPLASPSSEDARPPPTRHVSTASQGTTFSADSTLVNFPCGHHYQTKRQSTDSSEWERLTYGRHSKEWLFGGFSIKETAKEAAQRLSRRSSERSDRSSPSA